MRKWGKRLKWFERNSARCLWFSIYIACSNNVFLLFALCTRALVLLILISIFYLLLCIRKVKYVYMIERCMRTNFGFIAQTTVLRLVTSATCQSVLRGEKRFDILRHKETNLSRRWCYLVCTPRYAVCLSIAITLMSCTNISCEMWNTWFPKI